MFLLERKGKMLLEEFVLVICGFLFLFNIVIFKDIGIYIYILSLVYFIKLIFKKSLVLVNCFVVSEMYVFVV